MTWKADRTTPYVAALCILAGFARIEFSRDYVLGPMAVVIGLAIGIRAVIYHRRRDRDGGAAKPPAVPPTPPTTTP